MVEDRCIYEDIDFNDPVNIGKPLFWNLRNHIIAIEQMICSDEIEIALEMFDKIPAWYREPENYPTELKRLKKILYENLYDQYQYGSDPDEAGWKREDAEAQWGTIYTYPRAEVLREIVAGYNQKSQTPWLCEFSPSHGLLPLGLAKEGHKFHFFGKNLNQPALSKLINWLGPDIWRPDGPLPDQPSVFICCESLEHAAYPKSVYDSLMKLQVKPFDDVVLSVPYGCMSGGLSTWKTRPIGHLRGYSVGDFTKLANDYFPGYRWKLFKSVSMVLHGQRN